MMNGLKVILVSAATLAFVCCGSVLSAWSQTAVTAVDFGIGGQVQGAFTQLDNGQWQETAGQSQNFTFTEVARDDSAIRLEDASRNLAITLDLANKSITFGAIGDATQQPLYEIVATRGPEAAPGNIPLRVVYGENGAKLGTFVSDGGTAWSELDGNGNPVFQFVEVGRSAERIDLQDPSRNLALSFNLIDNTITFGAIGEAQQPLYQIVEISSALATVSTAAESIAFGSNGEVLGSFVSLPGGVWHELDKAGATTFTFVEIGRTPDLIQLEDRSRALVITLDLTTKLVSFGAVGDPAPQPIYDILTKGAEAGPPENAAATDLAQTDPGLFQKSEPFPSQIKLKSDALFPVRFTVIWTVPGSADAMSWTSDQQDSTYFHALPLPEDATEIRILGEAGFDNTWKAMIDRTVLSPNNKCYVITGTAQTANFSESEESSYELGDNC